MFRGHLPRLALTPERIVHGLSIFGEFRIVIFFRVPVVDLHNHLLDTYWLCSNMGVAIGRNVVTSKFD